MQQAQTIDIVGVIQDKTGRKVPGPVGRLLQRLIHEAEINDVLTRYAHLEGHAFLQAVLDEWRVQVSWQDAHNLPQSGRAIFVSNHPLGGLDGMGLSRLLCERYGDVRFLVNDMLYHLKPLQSIFLPVNTYGAQRRDAVQRIATALESDVPLASFPAGYCSRRFDGVVQDRPWQKSFVTMAIEAERDVVPVHFSGQLSGHFYLLDRIRRALGLKFDFTTALLPDEMFRGHGRQYTVTVGEPIPWQSLSRDGRDARAEAERIRALCYSLKK